MKKLFVLIVTLLMGFKTWAQYDITDTVGIRGRISKIEFLQKDWNHSDKVKQIFWVEITLKPDTNQS
jgi:hypothetical protein